MFEKIKDMLGRKKILDESITFSELVGRLNTLPESTKINVSYNRFGKRYSFKNMHLNDVRENITEKFRPDYKKYCEVTHQVFSEQQNEKHKITLRAGEIDLRIGDQQRRGSQWYNATLDYIIENRN